MKKIVNGIVYDMTQEEIAEANRRAAIAQALENARPLTESEALRLLLRQQLNGLPVDDHTALRLVGFYPEWAVGTVCEAGFKVQHCGKLWRAIQAHTAQDGWQPERAPGLWEQVCEAHTGMLEDPIPYDGNMALTQGSYYIQNGVIYLCIRDTGSPVYNPLADLVGLYVEVA